MPATREASSTTRQCTEGGSLSSFSRPLVVLPTLQAAINQVKVDALRVKTALQALEQYNKEALNRKGQGVGSANERSRTTITASEIFLPCISSPPQRARRR